jgi:hypothetical protein
MALCAKDGNDGRNERFAFIAGRFEVMDVVAYGDAEMDPCRDGVCLGMCIGSSISASKGKFRCGGLSLV